MMRQSTWKLTCPMSACARFSFPFNALLQSNSAAAQLEAQGTMEKFPLSE